MKHNVSVKFTGSVYNISCFIIDKAILEDLMSASPEDALFEENPISLVHELAKDHHLIANGFDVTGNFESLVTINDNEVIIESTGHLYEGESFEDVFDSPKDLTLFAEDKNIKALGENFLISAEDMLIIEVIDTKYSTLSTNFSTDKNISIQDIRLCCVDLDVDTQLSRAIYDQGLAQGIDLDIREIEFDGIRYALELNILNSYASSFYLVERNGAGEWTSKFLS